MAIDPHEYRLQAMESRHAALTKRVDNIDDHGSRRLGIVEEQVKGVDRSVTSLEKRLDKFQSDVDDRIAELQGTIVRAAITVAVSAVGSSLFIWLVVK